MNMYEDLIKKADKDRITRFVVGAVIVINSKVLLLQRPKNDFMGGIYELPSGKVESGESLITALEREVEEETGLKTIKIIKPVASFDYESKSGKKTRQFNFVITVDKFSEIKLTEHDTFVWSKLEELNEYQVTDSVKKVIKNYWNDLL